MNFPCNKLTTNGVLLLSQYIYSMKKKFGALLLCLITINCFSFDFSENIKVEYIPKYYNNQTNTVYLSTGFGNSIIADKSVLKVLENQTIYQIDLVYTSYKETTEFDQKKLNENRVLSLYKFLPQLKEDHSIWSIFEQTAAHDRSQASEFFHGFVIHYGESLNYKSQKSFFNEIQTPFSSIDIDNRIGGKAKYYTGSYIEMEKYAVTYKNGDPVEGVYQLQYREFRNQAEIALSGIPMVFSAEDEEVFNSVGMYEIRATKDGEELILQKDAVIHFQCTEILEDVAFYKMDDFGSWNHEEEITFSEGTNAGGGGMRMSLDLNVLTGSKQITLQKCNTRAEIEQGAYQGYSRLALSAAADFDLLLAALNEPAYHRYMQLKTEADSLIMKTKQQDNKKDNLLILVPTDDATDFIELITEMKIDELKVTKVEQVTMYKSPGLKKDERLVNVLGDEIIPNSPGLVMGLRSAEFGVYNCDQTMRISEPIALSPTYYDKATGKQLKDLYVACIIDLEMNASLSYHPNHLVTNGRGNTKLLVFSETKELYLLDKADFKQLDLSQKHVRMDLTNITEKVKNSDDLQAILDI